MTLNLKIEILKLFSLELHFDSAKKEEKNEEADADVDLIESLITNPSK